MNPVAAQGPMTCSQILSRSMLKPLCTPHPWPQAGLQVGRSVVKGKIIWLQHQTEALQSCFSVFEPHGWEMRPRELLGW